LIKHQIQKLLIMKFLIWFI